MSDPQDCKYMSSHEWCRVDGDTAVVGISRHAVEQLTDLVYVDLPPVGTAVKAGESFGEVESVKAVSELNSPVSGEVVEANTAAVDDPGVISADPYGDGWLIKVKMSDPGEIGALLDAAAYEASLEH